MPATLRGRGAGRARPNRIWISIAGQAPGKLSGIILGLPGIAILAGYGHISLPLLLRLSIAWVT